MLPECPWGIAQQALSLAGWQFVQLGSFSLAAGFKKQA